MRDAEAQATKTAMRAHRSHRIVERESVPGPRSGCIAEAAANPAARNSPIGVAITNPLFGSFTMASGVASACNARNPALARSAIDTRNSRASSRRVAASLIAIPSTVSMKATLRTSQKWEG
ncbi:MAG TPA: hypothetical protein VF036_04050 [Actinomycetota bacterium]